MNAQNFRRALLTTFALLMFASCAQKQKTNATEPSKTSGPKVENIDDVSEAYWTALMKRYPTWATSTGNHDYDDRLSDTSVEAKAKYVATLESLLARAGAVPKDQQPLTRALLIAALKDSLESLSLNFDEIGIDQLSGPQATLPYFFSVEHPMKTKDDVENLIARFHALPKYIDGLIANTERGMARGAFVPKVVAERVLTQVKALNAKSAEENPFVGVKARVSDELSGATEYRSAIEAAALNHVLPAFKKYEAMLENYVSKARESIGLKDMVGGEKAYRYLVRHHTTTDMSPEEIHELGKNELARIYAAMREIQKEKGHTGSLQEFLDSLKKEKSQIPESREALLQSFKDALKRADAALPQAFGRLPKLAYSVKPMDAAREKDAPAAYYQPGSVSDGREGIFVANLYAHEDRPLFNSDVLAFHEAVPGHHLQIAIAQELEGIPTFRRETGATAFVEGWGLYSEQLSDELGLYQTPEARMGYLGFAAWRAKRLVVDTGMHHLGWSRDRAIAFFKENSTLGDTDAVNEIDRYIVMPGQALAYMVGCLKILALRKSAQDALGAKFNLPAFHDAVLAEGAIPLSVLETSVHTKLGISSAE